MYIYIARKHHGKWAVLDTLTRVWYFPKGGKIAAVSLAIALNRSALS